MRGLERVLVVLAIALLAGLVLAIAIRLKHDGDERRRLMASAQLRGIAQGLALYTGSNGGRRPPVERWQEALVAGGYATTAMFAPRGGVGGYERFTLLPERESKWGTSFSATAPMIVENPRAWGGKGGHVVFNDNHVVWMTAEDCAALIAGRELQGSAELLRRLDAP